MRAGGGSEGGIGDGGGGIHGSREITTPRSELAGRTKTSPNQGGALVGEGDEKMNRVRWDGGAGEGNCGGREKATRGYSAGFIRCPNIRGQLYLYIHMLIHQRTG